MNVCHSFNLCLRKPKKFIKIINQVPYLSFSLARIFICSSNLMCILAPSDLHLLFWFSFVCFGLCKVSFLSLSKAIDCIRLSSSSFMFADTNYLLCYKSITSSAALSYDFPLFSVNHIFCCCRYCRHYLWNSCFSYFQFNHAAAAIITIYPSLAPYDFAAVAVQFWLSLHVYYGLLFLFTTPSPMHE